jgi:signal transduction histidine kinase
MRRMFQILVLFLVYFTTAKFGLSLGAVSKFATLVWPPTGIALAALLLFDFDLWPGIALGAFFINWSLGASPAVAAGISAGNTLEAIAGAYFLSRLGFTNSLQNLKSVFSIVIIAAFLTTLLSATIGVTCLYFAGGVTASSYLPTWLAWWLGDLMGNLLVAPFLLVWGSRKSFSKPIHQSVAEIWIVSAIAIFSSVLIFTDWFTPGSFIFPRPFFIFPILMIVAIRLGMRGVVTANLVLSIIIVYVTATRGGIFQGETLSKSLFEAQLFLAVLTTSNLILAATTEERMHLYVEAKTALASRDEFLSVASHELKTPLTLLSLRLQLFDRGLKSSLENRELNPDAIHSETVRIPIHLARSVAYSERQTRQLAAWVDELLDLSRIRIGKLQLSKEPLDLSELAREVLQQFTEELNQKKISVEFKNTDALLGLWDRMRIEQVMSNLLSNAIKYGDGQAISILTEKSETGLHAKFSVEDQGPGISPELHQKIFERFERVAHDDKTIQGLGLGLYICRQIVEAHQGTIEVTSSPGKGSTFLVSLPI